MRVEKWHTNPDKSGVMRRGLSLVVGAAVLATVSAALAQQAAAPWHLSKFAKLSRARANSDAAAPQGQPLKYLHVEVDFPAAVRDRKMHDFRVVDRQGKTVGQLWGFNQDRSLLIFEREDSWASLAGLYLDGLGHRNEGTPGYGPMADAGSSAMDFDAAAKIMFEWKLDRMVDFVVGPRMYWERRSPSTYRTMY